MPAYRSCNRTPEKSSYRETYHETYHQADSITVHVRYPVPAWMWLAHCLGNGRPSSVRIHFDTGTSAAPPTQNPIQAMAVMTSSSSRQHYGARAVPAWMWPIHWLGNDDISSTFTISQTFYTNKTFTLQKKLRSSTGACTATQCGT